MVPDDFVVFSFADKDGNEIIALLADGSFRVNGKKSVYDAEVMTALRNYANTFKNTHSDK